MQVYSEIYRKEFQCFTFAFDADVGPHHDDSDCGVGLGWVRGYLGGNIHEHSYYTLSALIKICNMLFTCP